MKDMSAFIPKFWGSHNKHNSEEWFMSLKHMPDDTWTMVEVNIDKEKDYNFHGQGQKGDKYRYLWRKIFLATRGKDSRKGKVDYIG